MVSSCCGMIGLISYLGLTVALNFHPIAIGCHAAASFLSRTDFSSSEEFCNATSETWLFFNMIFSIIHIVATGYIVYRVRSHYAKSREQPRLRLSKDKLREPLLSTTGVLDIEAARDVEQKASTRPIPSYVRSFDYTICFDTGVTIYFVLASLWCIWEFLGVFLIYHDGTCDTGIMVHALRSGLVYMCIASASLSVFLMCTGGMEHAADEVIKSHVSKKMRSQNKGKKGDSSTIIVWL